MIGKKSIKKIAIVGVGLMGGSLALGLKEKFPHLSLCGYARSFPSYRKLKKLKIVDCVERDLKKVVEDADMVVLALPIYSIIDYLKRMASFLKTGAVVLDLGSTKELIEKSAHRYLPKDVCFVGCHPLCGSEKSGAKFARSDLYEGALCLITSFPGASATKLVKSMWEALGARVVFLSASLHDKILSSVSHLPHLISFSLTNFIPRSYLKFISPSLRDLTRISGSAANVWTDIFLSNRKKIVNDTAKFIKVLKQFELALQQGNSKKIFNLITKTNAQHNFFL